MAQYFFCFFKEICHDTFQCPNKTARKHFQNRFPWEQKIWCALSVEHVRRKYFLHRIFIFTDRDFMSATAKKSTLSEKKLLQQQNHQERLLRVRLRSHGNESLNSFCVCRRKVILEKLLGKHPTKLHMFV